MLASPKPKASRPLWGNDCEFSPTLPFSASGLPKLRRRNEIVKVPKAEFSESNVRKANLVAKRMERIKLPDYADGCCKIYPINEFFNHPTGVESLLNTRALQSFHHLESNTYRCTLPKIQLLNFEVSPVLDLQVTPTSEDCTVEMLSCKFEGSKALVLQNHHFSAFMRNHITWDTNDSEPTLDVDVKLNITLEIYTLPFTLLPISAVETPGNLIMQNLVDRLVPILLQQLLEDYLKWVEERSKVSL